jgi:chorismate-pyruvate lyase
LKKHASKTDSATYVFDPIRGFCPKDSLTTSDSKGLNFEKMSPFLRALLVTDGTVTKFLEAFLWEPIEVHRVAQEDSLSDRSIPWLEIEPGMSLLRRQVLLQGLFSRRVYTFAESLIRTDRLWNGLREDLLQGRLGMGELLRDRRMETYRELLVYGRQEVGPLSPLLNLEPGEPLLFRSYRIFNKKLPTILITEKFPEHHFE